MIIITIKRYRYTFPLPDDGDVPDTIVVAAVVINVVWEVVIDVAEFKEITLTVSLPRFTTYASVPEGLNATEYGPEPTGIVLITVFVAVLITLTVLLSKFAT